MSKNDEMDKFTIAYEVVERRLAALWDAIDAVDTKTNISLGFASTIVVIIAGFYSLESRVWPIPSLVLFGLALTAYIILVFLSVLSYRVREWSYRPDPDTLITHCQDDGCEIIDMKRWVADECRAACYDNARMLRRKSALTNWVLIVFATETILLVSGLIYGLVFG